MELADAYSKFRKSLLAYILSKVSNREDAEDILHNVFYKMTLHIQTLNDKEKIQNWLYQITRNAIIDHYRGGSGKKRMLDLEDKLPADLTAEEETDNTMGMDKCLKAFIRQLPKDYKSIIIDSEINGVSQKDLALKYDMPYPSLRSRVQRGRERLRKLLLTCCHIETDSRGNIMEAVPLKDRGATSCGSCD